jgi:tetratricopeptide (TPR) repeat protein
MMTSRRVQLALACVACFALGALVQSGFAQGKKPAFDPGLYQGKDPTAAASALLDRALVLAEKGSWERLAVGRAWYLGGDKAKGQQILDGVTAGNKAEASDWFRLGRMYAEAGEWDKAQPAFDRALEMNKDDDSGMLEYGALANVFKDREKAETLFARAFGRNPREFWHFVGAGGSYLGVRPQQ